MLLRPGVDISRLNPEIRSTLTEANNWVYTNKHEMIIICTYGGTHEPSSLHYANNAYNANRPPGYEDNGIVGLRVLLGENFRVVEEGDEIHVEYNPKK